MFLLLLVILNCGAFYAVAGDIYHCKLILEVQILLMLITTVVIRAIYHNN